MGMAMHVDNPGKSGVRLNTIGAPQMFGRRKRSDSHKGDTTGRSRSCLPLDVISGR